MSRNENVNVSLRFRPLNTAELEENESSIWAMSKNSVILKPEWSQYLVDCKKLTGQAKSYSYNYCFSSSDSNLLIYSTVAKPLILASLEGYNATVFAYGQTGSGKTYTMMGSESAQEVPLANKKREFRSMSPAKRQIREPVQAFRFELPKEKGIVILALEDLFNSIKNNFERTYYLTCSYLEIYNEQVFDLLGENLNIKAEVLTVNEDNDGFFVTDLSEHTINNLEEVLEWIKKGEGNRKYASTALNHHSSRSHTIFRINVTSIRVLPDTEDGSVTTESIINFVDLAGSERVSNLLENPDPTRRSSQKTDQLLTEGKHINTSLFYLCQVINKLSEKSVSKSEVHIPYRNSNLTKILSSSLGGNSLTSIVCTATSTLSQFEMTLSTLRFGGIARNIQNIVEANIKSNKNSELLKSYQKDLDALRKELEEAQAGDKEIHENNLNIQKQLEDKINRLNTLLVQDNVVEVKEKPPKDYSEVFKSPAGYLSIDSRIANPEELFCSTQEFEDKGAVVFERMKAVSIELKSKNREIQDLNEAKSFLQDSKVNLINELKKSLEQCKVASDKKKQVKEKYRQLRSENRVLAEKLMVLELKNVGNLDLIKLKQLEKFFYAALDKTKELKFVQMVSQGVEDEAKDFELWKKLGVGDGPEMEEEVSEDSSLEFESSFYKSQKGTESSIDASEVLG